MWTNIKLAIKKFFSKFEFTSKYLQLHYLSEHYLNNSGWNRSRKEFLPVDKEGNPLPWFTYSSIYFIKDKLKPDFSVFEYGSGNSTRWFSSKVNKLISVEHDKPYYDFIKSKINTLPNVDYHFLDLDDGIYSSKIGEYKNEFDVVIIDGRDRINCTKNAVGALKSDGVIIFDNSDREAYNEAYDLLEKEGFRKIDFYGHGPIGNVEWGTTIYYKNNNCFDI